MLLLFHVRQIGNGLAKYRTRGTLCSVKETSIASTKINKDPSDSLRILVGHCVGFFYFARENDEAVPQEEEIIDMSIPGL